MNQLFAALYPAAMTVAATFLATVRWFRIGPDDQEQP